MASLKRGKIVPLMKAESITELAAAEDRGTGVV